VGQQLPNPRQPLPLERRREREAQCQASSRRKSRSHRSFRSLERSNRWHAVRFRSHGLIQTDLTLPATGCRLLAGWLAGYLARPLRLVSSLQLGTVDLRSVNKLTVLCECVVLWVRCRLKWYGARSPQIS
jgi:hypothetical protein